MCMNTHITVTSKGQTTIPAIVRNKLGLPSIGGVLQMRYNEKTGELIISKPVTLDEITAKLSQHIPKGIVPVTNVDQYYQENR